MVAPSERQRATAAANSLEASVLPKNSSCSARGTPIRGGQLSSASGGCAARLNGSFSSKAAAAASTSAASPTLRVKIETQSSERHAGTTPRVLSRPFVGLSPTRLLNAAGTRPDPAVSVPREKSHKPAATATAEPLLEPPGI